MNNILMALNVVFPTFIMMSVGVIIKKVKMVDEPSLTVMNRIVFRVFMSLLLFLNIYNIDINELFNPNNLKLMILTTSSIFFMFALAYLIYNRMTKDKNKLGVLIQATYRSNLILFGIPLILSVYDESKLGIVLLIITPVVPLLNIMGVIILETYQAKERSYKKLFISVLKNPLIVAFILGLICLTLKVTIPKIVLNTMVTMSKVATPLAFVVLGATLKFDNMLNNIKFIAVTNFMKLIIFPIITLSIALYLGFRNEYIVALLGVTASPTSVTSFNTVKEIGGDSKLAAEVVASSSVVSILTLFLWVYFLKTFNFI